MRYLTGSIPSQLSTPTSQQQSLSSLQSPASSHIRTVLLGELSDEVISIMVAAQQLRPTQYCAATVFPLGRAVNAVPVEATAFVHRAARFAIMIFGSWSTSQADSKAASEAARQWADDLWRQLLPLSLGVMPDAACANKDEDLNLVFGQHLPRLMELKQKWDPNNVFCNHNVVIPLPPKS